MSKKRSEEEGWLGFLKACSKLKNVEDFEKFFQLFLTIEEKGALSKRLLVVKALEEGKLTQREIAEKYQVSISQITRGSNALKVIDPSLRKFLKSLI
jgi:TrpR family trp operon transcriptional repressor